MDLNGTLLAASDDGYIDIVKFLVENGADINAKGEYGYTALIVASINGDIEIVKLLLENGADINAKDNKGYTALIVASVNGYIEIVKLLLENGADINAKNKDGITALIGASNNGHIDIVKLLSENGSDNNNKLLIYKHYETDICCICDCKLGNNIANLQCGHDFHKECILKSTIYSDKCPICRRKCII